MKIINKRGMVFGKVSIIDLLIIIAVIAAGYLVLSMLKPSEMGAQAQTTIVYTYETSPVSEDFVNQLFEGAELFNSSRNHAIGTLISFESKPRRMEVKDLESGAFLIQTVEGEYTVVMNIEASATESDHHYYVTQEDIKIGAMIPVKGKGFATRGYVTRIEEATQ